MRTTLNLDDDVLSAVRALAAEQYKTLGEVVCELVRCSLRSTSGVAIRRNSISLMPVRDGAGRATLKQVNRIRDGLV